MRIENDLPARAPLARWSAFIGVGTVAAGVHWLVAVALVRMGHATPLVANVLAWAVAFCVSVTGHRWLTFGDRRVTAAASTPRFLVVSLAALVLNECVLWLLLSAGVDYRIALIGSMLAAAVLTYVLGNVWAFRARTETVA